MYNDTSDLGILDLDQTTPIIANNRTKIGHMIATKFNPLESEFYEIANVARLNNNTNYNT